ncbi:hypothetical protein [Neobacillus sp. D3-1R]|uniref:hypothetical protein n=1 Tax=Neobacillus sp. D3-1R TaxID=3445778 RepID=UPI003FA0E35F
MKKYRKIVFTSILATTLIMPTTSYASNIEFPNDSKNTLSVINLIFSFFGNDQTLVTGSDDAINNIDNEYLSTQTNLNIGDSKISSKEMKKYNNYNGDKQERDDDHDYDREHDHDRDGSRDHPRDLDRECDEEREREHPKESKDIWREWYCNGDWDWFWKYWGK